MNIASQGIVKQSDIMVKICPYCHRKLSPKAVLQRKVKKMCICGMCRKVIDECYIMY